MHMAIDRGHRDFCMVGTLDQDRLMRLSSPRCISFHSLSWGFPRSFRDAVVAARLGMPQLDARVSKGKIRSVLIFNTSHFSLVSLYSRLERSPYRNVILVHQLCLNHNPRCTIQSMRRPQGQVPIHTFLHCFTMEEPWVKTHAGCTLEVLQ